jgi:GNAT superfamily N-acetyltransferase
VNDVTIRPATIDDLDGLLSSNVSLFQVDAAARDPLRNVDWPITHGRDWLAALIDDENALVLVADAGSEVVGHLIGTLFEPTAMWLAPRAELLSMHVDPSRRGQRIGARLVAAVVDWARTKGAVRLQVSAYAENDGAVHFYQANDFRPFSLDLVQYL